MKFRLPSDVWRATSDAKERRSERGIALVITLIMLAITLVMAVAFLALAQRERNSVSTTTDTTIARQAADSGLSYAQAQILASILSGYNGVGSSNAYNLHLLVSTNYINPYGFNTGGGAYGSANPTNVNYGYLYNGGLVTGNYLEQNIANLWYLPRAPVYVPNNQPVSSYDFRYYLDLNENGKFDTNGWQPVMSGIPGFPYYDLNGNPVSTYNPPNIASNFCVGDPEWIGVLEHPDAPHGPNNHFTSRYAFIAVPVGNTLDFNYLHNEAYNVVHGINLGMTAGNDGFMRNQGVGSWELNLGSFLADLNTNEWDSLQWGTYNYRTPSGFDNNGAAFSDALSLLAYRYNANRLATADNLFSRGPQYFPLQSTFDAYSDGPLQTTLDTNANWIPDNPRLAWSGADNTNHFFTPSDFFDVSKTTYGVPTAALNVGNYFSARLKAAGTSNDTYNAYTYYRMLDALGSDSTADDGKLNLNFANAVVTYTNMNGFQVPTGVNIVTGAETNLVPWRPIDFFTAASDQLLRTYTANWCNANTNAFTNTFAVTAPFSITNIPVWVSNRFVYSPSVHHLLQLAANIYDATTNGNNNLPHVFRPLFKRVHNGFNDDIFIIGYALVTPLVGGINDPQLATPYDVTQLTRATLTPIAGANGYPVNVYGVPWIVGAKKGLPSFNQLYLTNTVQVTRKLQYLRPAPGIGDPISSYTTNQMYVFSIESGLGISFWNPYANAYPRPVQVYAQDNLQTSLLMSNSVSGSSSYFAGSSIFYLGNGPGTTLSVSPVWPGTVWANSPPNAQISNAGNVNSTRNCFRYAFWTTNFFPLPSAYSPNPPTLLPIPPGALYDGNYWIQSVSGVQLPQMYLATTNWLQAYILDGNNVIDYVQLRDPSGVENLNQPMADLNGGNGTYWQWSTNAYNSPNPITGVSYGIYDQYWVSGHPSSAPPQAGRWADPGTFLSSDMLAVANLGTQAGVEQAESAYFNAFFTPHGQVQGYGPGLVNSQLSIQAPYTPTRTLFGPFLMQANDPMVHYLGSDLNSQIGAKAVWGGSAPIWTNGFWSHMDNLTDQPLPVPPYIPVGGRYQPWGNPPTTSLTGGDQSGYDLSFKDPGMWQSDNWDFPTNLYPNVGWIGRVHRGTPWQTIYLKSRNVLTNYAGLVGTNEWASWTGDIQPDHYSGQAVDASRSAPIQDRLLFDLFTTRFNDNSVRGTLPVNQSSLPAWSALLGGMVVLSNSASFVGPTTPATYTHWFVSPAGADLFDSQVWQIVNNTNGINATRTNTTMFPYRTFVHAGDVLATPALSEQSPYLDWTNQNQREYGINDEEYEWLPQQMMGLVRGTEQRYVLYCFGQTLRPAPNGTVLSGPYFQLVTNYQVTAESAVRAVIRIDNANTSTPHAVVESYNVLPPN